MNNTPAKKPAFLNLRTIISALLALAGVIALAVDVVKDFFPDYVGMIISFVSALISIYSIITGIIEEKMKEIAEQQMSPKLTAVMEEKTNEFSEILRQKIDEIAHEQSVVHVKNTLESFGVKTTREHYRTNCLSSNDSTIKLASNLIYLTSQSMHKSVNERLIDGRNMLSTKYYIYTLAASHVQELLDIMTNYVSVMISKIVESYPQAGGAIHIPYVIIPFSRNVILGEAVANKLHIPILVSQITQHGTDKFSPETDVYEHFFQTFFGIESLELALKNAISTLGFFEKEIVFHGIVMDCNVTRGTAAINAAKYLNEHVYNESEKLKQKLLSKYEHLIPSHCKSLDIRFEKVTDIATLFIASSNAVEELTKGLQSANFKLYYYFSLNETAKESIFAIKDSAQPYDNSSPEEIKVYRQIAQQCAFTALNQDADCNKNKAENAIQILS